MLEHARARRDHHDVQQAMLCSVVANGMLSRKDGRSWEVADFYLGTNPAFKPKPRRQTPEELVTMVQLLKAAFPHATVTDG